MQDIDTPTLKEWLAKARAARLKIAMGEQVSLVGYSAEGNHQRQYHQPNPSELRMIIFELETEITRREGGRRRRLFHI